MMGWEEDEQRTCARPPPAAEGPPRPPATGLLDRVRRVPGVTSAVIQRKDGARTPDDGHEGDAAGEAAFLMMVGSQLGAALRSGELQRAAVQGATRHLLLLANKTHYLGLLVRADSDLGAVESDVKKALARGGHQPAS